MKKKCIQNNKGLTLVEVMVALTILLIISGAFLKSFTLASRVNSDAKFEQDALVVAEGLMESFKAYDMDEIQTQFGNTVSNADFKFYNIQDPLTTKFITADYSIFGMRNVYGAGGPYSVDITFTPSTAPGAMNRSVMDTIDSMNKAEDAIITQNAAEQDFLFQELWQTIVAIPDIDDTDADYPNDVSELRLNYISLNRRTMYVNIFDDHVEFSSKYEGDINYPYVTQSGVDEVFSSSFSFTLDSGVSGFEGYKSGASGYKDVYLYYYPAYNNVVGVSQLQCPPASDLIRVNNLTDANKDVYVVKQRDSLYYSGTTLQIAEANYRPQLVIDGNYVTLFHNLRKNITDNSSIDNLTITGNARNDKNSLWDKTPEEVTLVYDIEITITDALRPGKSYTLKGSMNSK